MADLYDHPDLYDALLPLGAHLPFYRELARRCAGPTLELACGAGQVTIPIALDGVPVVGLDASAAMIEAARKRASVAGAEVQFVEGDMRELALGREFSLVFVARNSLLHLLTTEDLLASLRAVRQHLSATGIFAFDVFNPSVRSLARPAGQRFPVFEADTTCGRLRVEQTQEYEPWSQITRATWYVSTPERPDAWVLPMTLRNIFPQELPLLLAAAGLELVDRFGDLSSAPFGPGSPSQVCVCRRST